MMTHAPLPSAVVTIPFPLLRSFSAGILFVQHPRTSHPRTSSHIASHRLTSPPIASHRLTSPHITSPHIASHRLTVGRYGGYHWSAWMHAWLGDTALHAAVKMRKTVAMHALLVQGADTHRLVNAMGHTASDLCEQVGCRWPLPPPLPPLARLRSHCSPRHFLSLCVVLQSLFAGDSCCRRVWTRSCWARR